MALLEKAIMRSTGTRFFLMLCSTYILYFYRSSYLKTYLHGGASKMYVYLYIALFNIILFDIPHSNFYHPLHTYIQIDDLIFYREVEVIFKTFPKHLRMDSLLCYGLFFGRRGHFFLLMPSLPKPWIPSSTL